MCDEDAVDKAILKYWTYYILYFMERLLSRFLGYEFSTYGLNVINYSEMEVDQRPDPLAVVFPKVLS